MRPIIVASVVTFGLLLLSANDSAAGDRFRNTSGHGHHGFYGGHGPYGHVGGLRSVQLYQPRLYSPSYDPHCRNHYPRWHDTSHYDWHPGGWERHRNHYHYVPGHWDFHRDGHWDY